MRILMLRTNFDGFTASTLFYEQEAILQCFPGSVSYGPGFDYETNDVLEILDKFGGEQSFDAILCYAAERQLLGEPIAKVICQQFSIPEKLWTFPKNLHAVSIPKICWINDFWHCSQDEWSRILLGNGFSLVLSTYAPPFSSVKDFNTFFHPAVQDKIPFIPWPRAMNPAVFHDYHEDKIYDVAMLGAQGSFYPVRKMMLEQFSNSNLSFFYHRHPGYVYKEHATGPVGEDYARAINRSKVFASCTGRYKIPFIKIYEILACKSAILCDKPHGAEYLGLSDYETFIPTDGSDALAKAERFLNDPEALASIWERGVALFQSRHTIDKRAQELAEMLSLLLNSGELTHWSKLSINAKKIMQRSQKKLYSLGKKTYEHILDKELSLSKEDWLRWLKFGVNRQYNATPPSLLKPRKF